MLKYFCDRCGIETSGPNKLELKVHLFDTKPGYVDCDFNGVSGLTKVLDLCNKCYNDIGSAAVQKLNEEIK